MISLSTTHFFLMQRAYDVFHPKMSRWEVSCCQYSFMLISETSDIFIYSVHICEINICIMVSSLQIKQIVRCFTAIVFLIFKIKERNVYLFICFINEKKSIFLKV